MTIALKRVTISGELVILRNTPNRIVFGCVSQAIGKLFFPEVTGSERCRS